MPAPTQQNQVAEFTLQHVIRKPSSGVEKLTRFCICVCTGVSEASFLEIPTLTCTCVVATFFWLMLTLFIRKLKQVGKQNKNDKYGTFFVMKLK